MIRDSEILTYMKRSDDPAFTPNEIGDHFDLTNSAARRRLYNLAEQGKLGFKKPGHRTVLFWIAGDYSIDASDT